MDRRGVTSTFSYDILNRLVTESYADATVTRSYDFFGRLIQVNDTASGTFLSSFDLAGRLLSSSTPLGSVNYTYDGRGATASRQVVGQSALTYSYDPAWNLTGAALPQASATFSYNVRNQLASMGRLNGVSTAYTYDADARLLSLIHAKSSTLIDAESYGYDPAGDRNSHSTSIGQPLITQPTTNQFNVANQLVQFGSITDAYDSNGNLVQEGNTTAYTWDARNRLKSIVTVAGQTTNFTYDYAGNLIQQADSGASLNLTKSFVLDNSTNVAYEVASNGTSYSVLAGRSLDSHLAVVQSNGQTLFGLADGINSTIATVDQTGTKQAQFLYEPYGQTTASGTYPFQFAGRALVTGSLYYNRARFYSSATGRFISEDPIGLAGGPNAYSYARNSPTRFTDPTGQFVRVWFALYGAYAVGEYAADTAAAACALNPIACAVVAVVGGVALGWVEDQFNTQSQPTVDWSGLGGIIYTISSGLADQSGNPPPNPLFQCTIGPGAPSPPSGFCNPNFQSCPIR